jgi:hypothetical protein
MLAVLALAFTSCNKEEKTVAFQATTQQLVVEDESEAKVYIDNASHIIFEQNDLVTLYNVTNSLGSFCGVYRATSTGNSVSFVPTSSEISTITDGAFYAFYPGGEGHVAPNLSNGNRCTFTIDPIQNYRTINGGLAIPHNALYMAAKAVTTDLSSTSFSMRNICGILQLKLYSPSGKTIKKIRVTDKHFGITGDVQLIITEIDPEELTTLFNQYDENNPTYMATLNEYKNRIGYNVTNVTKAMTLDLGEGVTLGTTKNAPTEFYIVLRPLALSQGAIIEVSEDGETWSTIADSNKNNCIRPSVIKAFKAMNVD